MIFNSLEFLIFYPIVLLIYFVLPNKIKMYWLLVASYYFYMCWNAEYALLMLFSTLITYISGLLLENIKQKGYDENVKRRNKNLVVLFSFSINLAILFFFKYANFAGEVALVVLQTFHVELNIPTFDVILPVGISFYTFQALSYTMDVYRDEVYAEKNFFRYALFVSFFPQLVAGPIERSKNLLKQLAVPKKFDYDRIREGLLLMIWGFFLKIVLADRIAIYVDTVYENHTIYAGVYLLMATILFAVQIYCDFYGYSIIAKGSAKILGMELMENFDAPYLATSVAGFWRRWHISLTSWFKDYLYIPLGGSRKGKIRKYINKLVVFLVSGLWHGANMTFVVWGGLNGLYQIIGEVLHPIKKKIAEFFHYDTETIGHKLLQMVLTFVFVDFAWIFFRATSVTQAIEIVKSIFTVNNIWILLDGSIYNCGLDQKNFGVMLFGILILLFADYCKNRGIKIREIIMQQNYWCRCLIQIVAICFILVFGIWGSAYDAAGFIYFQF